MVQDILAYPLIGGLFGDHTSPISDTTALAFIGLILAGYLQMPSIIGLLLTQFILIRIILSIFGKKPAKKSTRLSIDF